MTATVAGDAKVLTQTPACTVGVFSLLKVGTQMASPTKKTQGGNNSFRPSRAAPKGRELTFKGGDGKLHTAVEHTVKTADGKEQIVVTSSSYHVPEKWEWDERRLTAADLIADGYAILEVARRIDVDSKTIYNWLQHPDFKGYIDKSVLETGLANKTMRLAILKKMGDKLSARLIAALDDLPITANNAAALIGAADKLMQSMAVEREQLINLVKAQNTNVNVNAPLDIKEFMRRMKPEAREGVEKLLDVIGDELIDELE